MHVSYTLQGHGKIELPVEAKPGVLPSIYTGHPSYAYPQGRDYAADRGYPAHPAFAAARQAGECPARPSGSHYCSAAAAATENTGPTTGLPAARTYLY